MKSNNARRDVTPYKTDNSVVRAQAKYRARTTPLQGKSRRLAAQPRLIKTPRKTGLKTLLLACLSICLLAVALLGCRLSMQAGDHLEDRNAEAYKKHTEKQTPTAPPPNADAPLP